MGDKNILTYLAKGHFHCSLELLQYNQEKITVYFTYLLQVQY